MLRLALVSLAAATAALGADTGPIPGAAANATDTSQPRLNGKRFDYNHLPYQADTSGPVDGVVFRGPQYGYNNCTTGKPAQTANCQTLIVNDITDFCLFAPPEISEVGNAEGETVTYCTKPNRNTRVIPEGTLTGVQFIKAPSYLEVTGFINQANLNIPEGTYGGELDSGGQDSRGNPIGGLAYSMNMPTSPGGYTQSVIWHLFIGGGMFCMKLCDNKAPNASGLCRHTLDTVGCNVNVPAAYQPDVFLSCLADDQLQVELTNTAIPASSQCTTYQSTALYPTGAGIPTGLPAGSSSTTSTTTPTGTPNPSGNPSNTKGSTTSSGTPKPSGSNTPDDAASLGVSVAAAALSGLLALAYMA